MRGRVPIATGYASNELIERLEGGARGLSGKVEVAPLLMWSGRMMGKFG